jgi:hypothetical protein
VKTVLITVIVQAVLASPPEAGKAPEPVLEVKAHAMQEFETKEACLNAAKGLQLLSGTAGFSVLWGCAPKDIGKLELEKAPKAKPQLQLPSMRSADRGSST